MVEPVTITALVTATITAINKLLENPLIAYLVLISFLTADALTIGAVGSVITLLVNGIGVNWEVSSMQILIIIGFFPLLMFALKSSANVNS